MGVCRKNESYEGRELRIRLFGGAGVRDGKIVKAELPDYLDPEELARLCMQHLMWEYGNEAKWVNEYWKRTHEDQEL